MKLMVDINDVGWNDVVMGYMPGCKGLLMGVKAKEIISCKDCKYCDRHHLVDGLFCYRLYEKYNKEYPQMIIEVDDCDFCSRGERK